MAIDAEQSRDREGEHSREERRERRWRRTSRDRSGEATPSAERRTTIPDATAVDAARAHARHVAAKEKEQEKVLIEEQESESRLVRLGKNGLKISGGALLAFAHLGHLPTRPVYFRTVRALDWIGRKMDGLANKLIDKKFPILSWLVNPLVSLIDASAKSLGMDKALAEHLMKNAADRKKLAEKMLKDFLAEESKFEKKADEAQKKKARHKHLKDVLGEDVAAVLEGEFNDLENASAAKVDSTPAPAAAPAAAPAETH